ncbi:MAG: pantetheine-phosphate adenylyltransferase [Candidatus Dormibacteraeota bacterium]|nr:pantetheine-phosphate adenylyltransferase [Candidatus Dormibacteraeota bacterium]
MTGLYPGSFDPFTLGHLDVAERAVALFQRLIVAVAANPEKRAPLFTPAERVAMIGEVFAGRKEVEVTEYTGLTVDFARARGAVALIKGLRTPADLEAELQQALMNRSLAPEIQTVFLPSGPTHIFVSSSILKDVAAHGRDIGEFVPSTVSERIKEKFN